MSNVRPAARRWQSPDHSRGVGPQAIQAAFGCRSLGAAQKKIQRAFKETERVAQVLVLQGSTEPIVGHLARLQQILETGPARPLMAGLCSEGHVARALGESREACLADGATPQEVELHIARIRRTIAEGYAQLGNLAAHQEARRVG
jgi:hypothetical protein